MATYVMSDIHGMYDKYKEILDIISFSDSDVLYILGDVIDRGTQSIEVLQDMMMYHNIIPLIGNHEYMALQCLDILTLEITEESLERFDNEFIKGLIVWLNNGGQTTYDQFIQLDKESQSEILDYLSEFRLYEEINIKGKKYVLTHAGLRNYDKNRPIDTYEIYDLIFESMNYEKMYDENITFITGHTPTRAIHGMDKIYDKNNHLAIDCGAAFGGKLAVYCLDTETATYV